MYLCIVTDTYPPDINGVALSLQRLKNAIEELGHEVEIIRPGTLDLRETLDENGLPDFRQWLPSLPVPGYRGVRFGLPGWSQLKHRWTERKPEAVYVATESPLGISAVQVAQQLGIRLTSGFHTNFHHYTNDYNLALIEGVVSNYLRYFHNETQITFAPAPDIAQSLRDEGYKRVEIFSRGVNCEQFSPQHRDEPLRASWQAEDDTPVALYVGRIAAEKNIPLVLRTFHRLQKKNPQLRCVLVGDGPRREQLEKENPQFVWAGPQRGADLARYYASADLFLFASTTETFGNVILEAMASGLTVASYDYAAASLLIENGVNGFSCSPLGNRKQFFRCAEKALENAQNQELRDRARARASTETWQTIASRFMHHIETLTPPKPEPTPLEHFWDFLKQ